VAQLVIRAVRNDRPMVVTDASHRETFTRSYVDLVMGAFDDVAAFDKELG
jgi:hypothetical protein